MILKHRDRELIRFSWNRYGDVCNLELDRSQTQFLPLGLRKRMEKSNGQKIEWILDEWIRSRTAPLNRRYLRELLSGLGFKPRTADYHRQLVELCRGLSLNDVYWLAADDSRDTWKDVNLYQNPFSTAVAAMAFSGGGLGRARGAASSPEYTTNGALAKCWRRLDDGIKLFKRGSGDGVATDRGENAVGYESYSEFFAAQIASAMGLEHVAYDLAQFKGHLCSTCPLFTSERYGYLPAREIMTREEAIADRRFADVFFFDAVVFNTDRHLGNFGFLIDNETNEIVKAAPIFDNGYALFSQAISAPGQLRDEFRDLRRFLARKSPALTEHWLDIPGGITEALLGRLEKLKDFAFTPHRTYNPPRERLDLALYFVQKRIAEIMEFGAKADNKLKVSLKLGTIKETSAKASEKLADKIVETLSSYPKATKSGLARLFKVSERTIARCLKDLQDAKRICRIGSRKSGLWKVIA